MVPFQSRRALRICGCSWRVASDDFVFPACTEVLCRSICLLIIFCFLLLDDSTSSSLYVTLRVYLMGSLCLGCLLCLNLSFLALNSMRGRIWQEEKRKKVVPFIYVNVVLTVIEIVWTSLGTYWVTEILLKGDVVKPIFIYFVLISVMGTWMGLILKLSIQILAFKTSDIKLSFPFWTISPLFRDIADVLAYIFHDPDFVPTDIAAALFLIYYSDRQPLYRTPSSSSLSSSIDVSLSDIRHFSNYSLAAYGYFYFLLQNGCRSGLYRRLRWNCVHDDEFIVGDNCITCNVASIRSTLPFLRDDDIVYVNLVNDDVGITPYFVALDHERKKIVVVIRGTLSLTDALTDLMATPTRIFDDDDDDGYYGHGGMIKAAKYVFRELMDKNILNKALAYYDEYEIVVTGHSLGAGTAVILTFLLRSVYGSSTRCYAYSPPGGLLCSRASKISKEFTISVIVGDDLIPRLSFSTLDHLTKKLKTALMRCPLPKYRILGSGLFNACFGSETESMDREEYDEERNVDLCMTVEIRPLMVPGRCFYYYRVLENGFRISEVDSDEFREIVVSPHMLSDHLPTFVSQTLSETS